MQYSSHNLSVIEHNWKAIPLKITDHRLDSQEVVTLSQQSPQLKHLKQKYPQINVEFQDHTIKKITNGIYIGSLNSQQKPQGYGIIRYDDTSVLYAKFKDGKANGKGLMLLPENTYYVGDFIDNQYDGRGQYVSPQVTYIGEFRNNKFQGKGELQIIKNSGKFIGDMQNGQMKHGTLTWETKPMKKSNKQYYQKFQYIGGFKNNKFEDENGVLISNAGTYTGSFKNGKKQGQGRFEYTQKYQYIGTYADNVKSGFGTLYNPQISRNGDIQTVEFSQLQRNISYKGEFKNNLPHGKGQVYQQQSKRLQSAQYIQGIWSQLINNKSG